MFDVARLIWPSPDLETAEDRKKREQLVKATVSKIMRQEWSAEIDTSLEEARAIYSAEDERRKYADQKASIYLTLIAAIVPFSLPFVSDIWRGDSVLISQPARVCFFISFMFALSYLVGGAWWSFRTISVRVYHRVDVEDLLQCWDTRHPKARLTRKILCAALLNRAGTNEKFTKAISAHQFLIRAIIFFVISTFIAVAGDDIYEMSLFVFSALFPIEC